MLFAHSAAEQIEQLWCDHTTLHNDRAPFVIR